MLLSDRYDNIYLVDEKASKLFHSKVSPNLWTNCELPRISLLGLMGASRGDRLASPTP